jgi:5-hydroxyisourate hydrolase
MSAITTHVLDTARGRPAAGVAIRLERLAEDEAPTVLGRGETDRDGRLRDLLSNGGPLRTGRYRLVFDTGAYFREQGIDAFYPEVAVVFELRDAAQHYHVPLLLSPFGYSTYRGS